MSSTPCASSSMLGDVGREQSVLEPWMQLRKVSNCAAGSSSSCSENGFHTSTSRPTAVVISSGPEHQKALSRACWRFRSSGMPCAVSPHTHRLVSAMAATGGRQCLQSTVASRLSVAVTTPIMYETVASNMCTIGSSGRSAVMRVMSPSSSARKLPRPLRPSSVSTLRSRPCTTSVTQLPTTAEVSLMNRRVPSTTRGAEMPRASPTAAAGDSRVSTIRNTSLMVQDIVLRSASAAKRGAMSNEPTSEVTAVDVMIRRAW